MQILRIVLCSAIEGDDSEVYRIRKKEGIATTSRDRMRACR